MGRSEYDRLLACCGFRSLFNSERLCSGATTG